MPIAMNGTGTVTGMTGLVTSAPAFSAYNSTVTSLVSSTWTKVFFQTEEYDLTSAYDPTTSRFTPLVAGYYLFTGEVQVASTTSAMAVGIYKNGAMVKQGAQTSSAYANSVAAVVYMNGTTDYAELWCYQNAATQNTSPNSHISFFQGVLMRAA